MAATTTTTFDGGAGDDLLFGGNGNDIYIVDSAGDTFAETSASGGFDTVQSSVSRNLTAFIENLTLTGVAAITGSGNSLNNTITGNGAANTLYGYDGADTLNGGGGDDTMFGANGNDTYVVDSAGDITVEGVADVSIGGIDTVISSVNRNLNANFENLTLTGAALIGYGNILNNTMTGNAGANLLYGFDGADTLDGGTGADQLYGGNGDDIYIVDNAGDVVGEVSPGGGTADTVVSSLTYNLTANLENLLLTGIGNLTGAGNNLNNFVTGNLGDNTLYGLDGNDVLNGVTGADQMFGGTGDDTYFVDNVGDVVTEVSASNGTDTVYSSIDYSLASVLYTEHLSLVGTDDLQGDGNDLGNEITGNYGDNVLNGGDGDDILSGGLGSLTAPDGDDPGTEDDIIPGGDGADTLTGGDGADAFIVGHVPDEDWIDTVTDFVVDDDTIWFGPDMPDEIGAANTFLAEDAFHIGASADDAEDRIIYDDTTGAVYFDSDGTGEAAQVQILWLSAGLALTNDDFFLMPTS